MIVKLKHQFTLQATINEPQKSNSVISRFASEISGINSEGWFTGISRHTSVPQVEENSDTNRPPSHEEKHTFGTFLLPEVLPVLSGHKLMGTTSNSEFFKPMEERERERESASSAETYSFFAFTTFRHSFHGGGAPFRGFSALRLSLFSSKKREKDGKWKEEENKESERVFFSFCAARGPLSRPLPVFRTEKKYRWSLLVFTGTRKRRYNSVILIFIIFFYWLWIYLQKTDTRIWSFFFFHLIQNNLYMFVLLIILIC